jgi:hypothetical protein
MNRRNSPTGEETFKSNNLRFNGIILRADNFGDGNRIITLLDERLGKISLFAFGAAREKSRRKSAVMAGNLVNGIAVKAKNPDNGLILSVREISLGNSFDGIRAELKRLSYLYLVFETLDTALTSDHPFPLFPLAEPLLTRMAVEKRFEKYALYFIILTLNSEGIFPEYSSDFAEELKELTSEKHRFGNGTLRFIHDCEIAEGMEFWDGKEISLSVQNELITLIARIFRYHFGRELKSLSLLTPSP